MRWGGERSCDLPPFRRRQFGRVAEDAALDFLFVLVAPQVGRQAIERDALKPPNAILPPLPLADGAAKLSLYGSHLCKPLGEVAPDLVPVAGLPFDAADAVVVR